MRNYVNYFTEIEDHFQQRRGSLLLLSTLDWVLIDTWREAGLPLEVVLRGIDASFDKHQLRQERATVRGKRFRPINGLAWCAQAVLEAAEQAANASLAEPSTSTTQSKHETGFEPDRVAAFLRRNADALAAATVPASAITLVAETVNRLHSLAADRETSRDPGENLAENTSNLTESALKPHPLPPSTTLEDLDRTLSTLEERLVAALLTAIPEPNITAIRAEADTQLAPFRSRMGAVQIRQLQQQFLHKRLLEQHALPRLSLFYMSLA